MRFPFPSLSRRLAMTLAAGAVALAGLATTPQQARADDADIFRFIAGAIVIGAIVHAIDENNRPSYAGRWVLPNECLETVRIDWRNVDVYNGRCLSRAGYQGLPGQCRYEFRYQGRNRAGYVADCMYQAGYRGGYSRRADPPRYDPPYADPPRMSPPSHGHGHDRGRRAWLPDRCEMHYRQSGRRVAGYWSSCLRDAGLRDLPGQCRVTSTDGDRIYNARCLEDEGYRRR